MKDKIVILIAVLFSYLIPNVRVLAEGTCSYKDQADLNKAAGKVETSYSFERDETGAEYFLISIYNVVDNIYVDVESETLEEAVIATPSGSTAGVYSFRVNDIDNVIKYEMYVRSSIEGCQGDLRKLTLTKPKKNKYHDYDECKFEDTEKIPYCQEWITKDFGMTEKEILAKIEEQRSLKQVIIDDTKNETDNIRASNKLELLKQIRRYAILGLSIGISLDIIFIYLKISDIRRSSL